MLRAFGSEDWIALILNSVSYNQFSISYQEKITGYFESSRRLRLGDHIFPFTLYYLFITSEEPFSKGLSDMHATGKLIFYGSSRGCVPISHLLYADDMLLFGNG